MHKKSLRPIAIATLLLHTIALALLSETTAQDFLQWMPRSKDHTSSWWRDGFPGVVENADWRRIVKTGSYWFMLDTDTLQIPRIGSTSKRIPELSGAQLALKLVVDGNTYLCRGSRTASRFTGPRLIESGRFLQRADITDLVFTDANGAALNVNARFETAAWPDQLGLVLTATPGHKPILAGKDSFGRVHGGFGFDGTNELRIPATECKTKTNFTLSLWAFIPRDYKAGTHNPWLVCKGHHEAAEGNFGILLYPNGIPIATLNIGGGSTNWQRATSKSPLKLEQWNHLAVSYDSDALRLYVNGQQVAETKIGKKRIPCPSDLTIGNRGDSTNRSYRFRGVVDEVQLHGGVLTLDQLRQLYRNPQTKLPSNLPVKHWSFRDDIEASMTKLGQTWNSASIEMRLTNQTDKLETSWSLPPRQTWRTHDWHQAAMLIDPVAFMKASPAVDIKVLATGITDGVNCPVTLDHTLGWHRIDLNGIRPTMPNNTKGPSNDAIERIRITLSNSSNREQPARLLFDKSSFHQRIGFPITGISAVLRDTLGNPTGIPVQLSKNWHNHSSNTAAYAGHWFHGISQVRLPAKSKINLELTLAYGQWGGVAAASHAQLSLIGWGGNQRWDESAIGAWGESICYDPEQAQAQCSITDVRPLMVKSMSGKPWTWTCNVGGGDFFRLFDPQGKRAPHSSMQARYHRQGPCLTEVVYSGGIANIDGLWHHETVSLSRSDDYTCGTYQIKLRIEKPVDFSRFVIFQIGADTYLTGGEKKMAIGTETGLSQEWTTQWGGNVYRTEPIQCEGKVPWVSLHEAVSSDRQLKGAWANRGIVIRNWNARLGGKVAKPWIAERGIDRGSLSTSTLDLVPPPGLKRLMPGDFVTATIEHVVVPQCAADYYGPNEALRDALKANGNTWKMIHRQASVDDRQIQVSHGFLKRRYPDIRIAALDDKAEFILKGGLGYVPVSFENLSSHEGYVLTIDGAPVDQSVHGNDFWQTDFDASTQRWSQTYNILVDHDRVQNIRFARRHRP